MLNLDSLELGAVNVDANESCCICYDAYSTNITAEDADIPVQLPCGHVFGAMCISKWLAIKDTCPLCRYQMFDTNPNDHDYPYDIRLNEYDSHDQTFGTPSELNPTYSVIPDIIDSWECAIGHQLISSSAHSSTCTLRIPATHLGTRLAHQQHTGHSSSARVKVRRLSGLDNAYQLCYDDVWITALSDEYDELIAPESEDSWALLPEDDDDDELELHQWNFSPEFSSFILDEDFSSADCIFDDLYASHLQWMEELNHGSELSTYDVFDYLV
jgi:hypothetical protein